MPAWIFSFLRKTGVELNEPDAVLNGQSGLLPADLQTGPFKFAFDRNKRIAELFMILIVSAHSANPESPDAL